MLQQALEGRGAARALLSFENAAGLNLQYVCHHVVLYAPLWAQDTVAAVANEQQAIGRVYRHGDQRVTVHRMLMHKEDGNSQTVDEHLRDEHRRATINAAATSNGMRARAAAQRKGDGRGEGGTANRDVLRC